MFDCLYMYTFRKILLLILLFSAVVPQISAVTKDEFEQARTIAAQQYLRYANAGSGYLDDIEPKSIAELEAVLKTKEKENIKTFLAVKIASDYATWDKDRLAEYWSNTFYTLPGAPESFEMARKRTARKISAMQISTPESQQSEPTTELVQQAEEEEITKTMPVNETVGDTSSVVYEAADEIVGVDEEFAVEETNKGDNSTLWYVVILVILVIIVIALVVVAKNAIDGRSEKNSGSDGRADDEMTRLRKNFAEKLSEKNAEIEDLNRQIESLEKEIATLKSRSRRQTSSSAVRKSSTSQTRVIYLSQANAKGVFLRADATFSLGNSIFRLVSTNGVSGTFSIIDDPTVHEMALMMPQDFLINACDGKNLQLARGAQEIVTDEHGTAIFENGYWRVSRKARIHYEK